MAHEHVYFYIHKRKIVFDRSDHGERKIASDWLTYTSAQTENNINVIINTQKMCKTIHQ